MPSTTAAASPGGAVPSAGNWEGVGADNLPLSFSLARRHRRLVATSIALGAPFICPATERDAETIPLSEVSYTGPGGAGGSSTAVLAGQAGHGDIARISGQFATSTSGTFSVQVKRDVGCGWQNGTLTWQVRRARRLRIADRTWTASLNGPDIAGQVELTVAALGRVLASFRSSFTCQTATAEGTNQFAAAPAYEFIRPDGRFYSPLHGDAVKRHPTIWSGRFTAAGAVVGTLRIYDSCTRRLVSATFHGG